MRERRLRDGESLLTLGDVIELPEEGRLLYFADLRPAHVYTGINSWTAEDETVVALAVFEFPTVGRSAIDPNKTEQRRREMWEDPAFADDDGGSRFWKVEQALEAEGLFGPERSVVF
jgi:hypothetical protein